MSHTRSSAAVQESGRVKEQVCKTAEDLRDSAASVAVAYAADIATLTSMFAELERGGAI